MKMRTILVIASLWLISGCFLQSKSSALKHVCDIPEDLQSDPTKVGPYMAGKIHNREVKDFLTRTSNPNELKDYLSNNGIDPDSCDLFVIFKKKPEPAKKTTEPEKKSSTEADAP